MTVDPAENPKASQAAIDSKIPTFYLWHQPQREETDFWYCYIPEDTDNKQQPVLLAPLLG